MYIQNIVLILTYFLCTEGLDIKLRYCRFRCSNSCKNPEDKSNPIGTSEPPEAYYWRDFHGVIPPDAYPLGPSTQFPQTYIGLAFDPSKNGTFVTTIYDGLEYVYTVLKNETAKIDKHIQILCTKSPGQLSWVKLTRENFKTVSADRKNVRGGLHSEFVNKATKPFNHFIVKTNKCHITYAGAVSSLGANLEYALIDGSSSITDQYLWLMYKKESPSSNPETSAPSTKKKFFSHYYEYGIRANSIIPKFYKQLTIGSCSVTCTNEDKSNSRKIKNDEKLAASMAYFWKPNPVIKKEEAYLAGKDYRGPLYVGQAFLSLNTFDVGLSRLESAFINEGTYTAIESNYFHVLSSNFKSKLNWVNTTSEDFANQDKNRMIPGGALDNGTETFVCRDTSPVLALPGSARVFATGTYCYAMYGPVAEFQVLMYTQEKTD